MDQSIIDRANTFITSDNISIEELLKSIYDDKKLILKEKEDIEKNLSQAELLRKSFEAKNANVLEKEASIIEQAKTQARKILEDAKSQVSNAIQEINLAYETADISNVKSLNNTRNKLNDAIKDTSVILSNENGSTSSLDKNDIYVGMQVFVTTLNQYGIISSLVNKHDEVLVQIGSVKMMVNLNNIAKSNLDEKQTNISITKR